jgi:hypothetical protein
MIWLTPTLMTLMTLMNRQRQPYKLSGVLSNAVSDDRRSNKTPICIDYTSRRLMFHTKKVHSSTFLPHSQTIESSCVKV